jgi:serine protease Do
MRARRPLVEAMFVALLGCQGASPSSGEAQEISSTPPPPIAPLPAERRTALTEAVSRVAPAVVTVQTETVQRVAVDPFEYFFGGRSGERTSAGIGSGFITRADGIIITNAHVVAGATRVFVAMRDGKTFPAQVLGADEINDLAVLDIEAEGLPVAPLGNSDALAVGEWAIAIGNPFGFLLGNTEPSVTQGVISAVGRNLVGGRAQGDGVYVDMIQTDASINPGNSGGPLISAAGEVIGVNSSIYSPSGGSVGLGFAIPINRARRVAEDLVAHGAVRRPWIGIQLRLTEGAGGTRASLVGGAPVRSVVAGSPAAQAGLRAGDVIVRAGGRPVRNVYDWEAALLQLRVGEALPVTYTRDGREATVTVRVADLPEVSAPKVEVMRELELVTLTDAIRAQRGVRSARGAVIFRASDRIAQEIGLQAGDVIVQVNRAPVVSAEAVAQALDALAGRGPIRVYFERDGRIYSTDFSIR